MAGVAGVLGVDRIGKGLRTAPRDALIAAASDPASLARSFGVHRALDTTGAVARAAAGVRGAVGGARRLPAGVRPVPRGGGGRRGPARAARAGPASRRCGAAVRGGQARCGSTPSASAARPRPSLRLLAEPRMGRLVLAAGLLGLLTLGDAFLYLVLQDRSDLAAEWFPLLFVGTNLAYLALSVPFGRLADRLGRARVMVAGHLFLAARIRLRRRHPRVGGDAGRVPAAARRVLRLDGRRAGRGGRRAGRRARCAARPSPPRSPSWRSPGSGAAVGFGWLWLAVGRADAVLGMAVALVARRRRWQGGCCAGRWRPDDVTGPASSPSRWSVSWPWRASSPTSPWAGSARPAASGAPARASASVAEVEAGPHLVFRDTTLGPSYGHVALAALGAPDGPRAVTPMTCDRVDRRAGRTLCLSSRPGVSAASTVVVTAADGAVAAPAQPARHAQPGAPLARRDARGHDDLRGRRLLPRRRLLHAHLRRRRRHRSGRPPRGPRPRPRGTADPSRRPQPAGG